MQRREFIAGLGTVAAWPLAAHAQQIKSPRRIAALFAGHGDDPEVVRQVARFQGELAKLGWLEGQTIHVDYRFGVGNVDQYTALAKELVGLHPELIVTQTTPLTAAMQQETRTIPIVFMRVSDPVGAGFAASLARPGGNLTGLLQYEPGIVSKWLAMLKEIAPRLASVAFVSNPAERFTYSYFLESAKAAAQPLVLEVVPNPVANAADIESSIAAFARLADGGLLISPSLINIANRALIIGLAVRYRLPAVYPWRYFVSEGGLMSYGIDDVDMLHTASYVDRILRGAKPADFPVQAPTKYETVVNLKTAKALGFDRELHEPRKDLRKRPIELPSIDPLGDRTNA
jgi:putative ABC transport system substrate-binding protein